MTLVGGIQCEKVHLGVMRFKIKGAATPISRHVNDPYHISIYVYRNITPSPIFPSHIFPF